ncbi:MAG: hypothetical protein EA370_11800 [Wenzhouxiangella sp.]|nr:MAG: hypothetical protein EA370_11800 [Wenzhouxiangella sp.]
MTINEQQLDQRLAALDRQCDPPPEAWEAISAKLARRRSRWPWMALAASLCGLVVGLSLLLGEGGPLRPAVAPGMVEETPPAGVESEQPWRPALQRQAVFDTAWDENEAAIKALEEALASEPDNLLLMEFLAEARLRQSSLIELALRIEGLEAPRGVKL